VLAYDACKIEFDYMSKADFFAKVLPMLPKTVISEFVVGFIKMNRQSIIDNPDAHLLEFT
jgi:hypothetical protein